MIVLLLALLSDAPAGDCGTLPCAITETRLDPHGVRWWRVRMVACVEADFDGDGVVGLGDLMLVSARWGRPYLLEDHLLVLRDFGCHAPPCGDSRWTRIDAFGRVWVHGLPTAAGFEADPVPVQVEPHP